MKVHLISSSAIGTPAISPICRGSLMIQVHSIMPLTIGTPAMLLMSRMFANARAFNQAIGNWNTSKVISM
jgi:surface protein